MLASSWRLWSILNLGGESEVDDMALRGVPYENDTWSLEQSRNTLSHSRRSSGISQNWPRWSVLISFQANGREADSASFCTTMGCGSTLTATFVRLALGACQDWKWRQVAPKIIAAPLEQAPNSAATPLHTLNKLLV